MAQRASHFSAVIAELNVLIERLRLALREALDEVLPNLGGARACGRALGLKRGLGWQVFSLATASDLPTALKALPQRKGWKQVLARFGELRCPADTLVSLREAAEKVSARLDDSRINRSMLRAVAAGGLDSARETMAMLQARRAMRQGAEDVFGIRTEAKIATYVVGRPDRRGLSILRACSSTRACVA